MAPPATRALPCGSWPSPVTSELIVAGTVLLGEVRVDGDDLLWLEGRPTDDGRVTLVRRRPGEAPADVSPAGFNVRTRVHEYGGGAYAAAGGTVVAVRFADQRLCVLESGGPRVISPDGDIRHADLELDLRRGVVHAVQEDHTGPGEARNRIVAVPLDGGAPRVLAEGHDFYAAPRLSPDGSRLCWLQWDHPDMPWDATELWVADLDDDGVPHHPRRVGGGPAESVLCPRWSPDSVLHAVSDRSGWWNLHREDGGALVPVVSTAAEFAQPPWQFGFSHYTFLDGGRIAAGFAVEGGWRLGVVEPGGDLRTVDVAWTEPFDTLQTLGGRLACTAATPTRPPAVVILDVDTLEAETVRESARLTVDEAYISVPERIVYPTSGGLDAHALYYAPCNPECTVPDGERPPLLVISHGGPTSQAVAALLLGIQYWTSRGVGVVDVDYGGSTGYGRAYRERLRDAWGIVDVDDCCNAARFLVDRGDADAARLWIRGGSAGGFTTLAALAFRDVFTAGASHFGVGDLGALARDTHKFESRYLDRLVGPYPEREDIYRERSPVFHADRISCPVILFQGLEDMVVPPAQSEAMFEALRSRGIPCAYVPFEGEQHGFRKAENIRRALDGELSFYGRVFDFVPAGGLVPLAVENLPGE